MTGMKTLAIALGVTLALEFIGLQSSVAQPGSGFENRGERSSEGITGHSARTGSQQNPASGQANRDKIVRGCTAQAQSQARGNNYEAQQQRYFIYVNCMTSRGQRP
ncbi:MAG TPA: hypothetical protein VH684_05620 [Xanthobacteraceae bacterium]|jgi:hypothetical protein